MVKLAPGRWCDGPMESVESEKPGARHRQYLVQRWACLKIEYLYIYMYIQVYIYVCVYAPQMAMFKRHIIFVSYFS